MSFNYNNDTFKEIQKHLAKQSRKGFLSFYSKTKKSQI